MNIIFYDGECGMCSSIVASIAEKDTEKQFYFAPLSGETAKEKLSQKEREGDSVILLTEKEKLERAEAFIAIMTKLNSPLKHLQIFPKSISNLVYRLIARFRRYIPVETLSLPKDRCLP